jgi:tetratricopeptide (TPR) repeat protein
MSWSNVFVQLFRFVTCNVQSQAGSDIDSTKPTLYPFDSQALTQLAVGSSVFIAFVLAITDVIPLIPNATSVIGLALRVVGDWIIVAVIWFLAFLAMTQSLKFISRGVWVSDKGIKLSRFDRVVPWTSMRAVAIEPNFFFTKLFGLKHTARRLTILFHFEIKNKILSSLLFPNYIPSFFFSKETFDQLVRDVFERSGALPAKLLPENLPCEYAVVAATGLDGSFEEDGWKPLRKTYSWLNKQKILVTGVILLSLVVFLGRRAMVYYCFNSAGKAASEARFEVARDYYQWSVKLEPMFAAGWNGLGQAEFRLAEQRKADFSTAVRDWRRAIFLKLDYVEPRLNIVRVCLYRRDYAEASRLLEHALKLAPYDGLALLEKAELDLALGHYSQAQKDARLLLSQGVHKNQNPEYIFKARCLLAQAKLAQGDARSAQKEIEQYSSDPQSFTKGEDVTYLLMTRAQILLALGQLEAAENHIRLAVRRQPYNQEVLVQAALISLARHQLADCKFFLERARTVNSAQAANSNTNPWLATIASRLAAAQEEDESAKTNN